jgi:hypothetical protein
MSTQSTSTPSEAVARIIGFVVVLFLVGSGGGAAIWKYLRHNVSHEKLTTVSYHGEWASGEYRECISTNAKEEDERPQLICSGSSDLGKVFKVSFSGDLTYDAEKPEGKVHYWLCRRYNRDATFSCSATQTEHGGSEANGGSPVQPRELTSDEVENLRKRNECEQRFYSKKIYEVNGVSIGPACKQNPDRRP